jgi:hypothetical protein
MEYLNSKVNHKDYMFDHIAWGVDVMKRVNSPPVKILYDIYHVQISDGDVVRNLRDNFDTICHIHVAGVPSRNEIDNTQELNYSFIANAIADLGYTGFIGHEFRPSAGRDPIKSLEQCFEIMNVSWGLCPAEQKRNTKAQIRAQKHKKELYSAFVLLASSVFPSSFVGRPLRSGAMAVVCCYREIMAPQFFRAIRPLVESLRARARRLPV